MSCPVNGCMSSSRRLQRRSGTAVGVAPRRTSYPRYASYGVWAETVESRSPLGGPRPARWQDVAVPRPAPLVTPVVTRRAFVGGTALAMLTVAATACGSPPAPPRVDELKAQAEMALHDSALASAAAAAADPPTAAALNEVAAERSRHAQALETEITRVAGSSTTTSTPAPTETSTTGPPAAPPPSPADVVNALRASADSARQLALISTGYRAGLLASIAAACTAAFTVALAPGEPAP